MESERFVLDSYAVIAYLEGTKGVEQVKKLLRGAGEDRCQLFMSIINLGEVLYIIERENGLTAAQDALAHIDELPIKVMDANRASTLVASHLKAQWKIAYADCFAAALAQIEKATIVTGDPEFKQLENASVAPVLWVGTE